MITTVHFSSNYTDRVDANQEGRIAMEKITQALNSACVAGQVPPVVSTGSTGSYVTDDTHLYFYSSQTDGPVVTPNLDEVALAGTLAGLEHLLQHWRLRPEPHQPAHPGPSARPAQASRCSSTPAQTVSGGSTVPMFQYYGYTSGGAISGTPFTTPLSTADAATTAKVVVSFRSLPADNNGNTGQPRSRSCQLGRPAAHARLGHHRSHQHPMQLTSLRSRVGRRLRDERGMTMLLALFVLTITTLILGGTYMAVLNDTHLSRNDLDQKRAYAAAQAGIQAYNYQLNQNENYWQTCNTLGTAASPITVPGSTDTGGGTETYYVTPLAASTAPANDNQCDTANALATMIEGSAAGTASGSFRIKSTGTSGNPAVSRTIVAQYKPPSFLDYVYYTDYETLDPAAITGDPSDCARHYSDQPRPRQRLRRPDQLHHRRLDQRPAAQRGHALDLRQPGASGAPVADQIQAPALHQRERRQRCSNSPTMTGTYNAHATSITPPPDNGELLSVAQSAYHFTGKTTIVLNGSHDDRHQRRGGRHQHPGRLAEQRRHLRLDGEPPAAASPTRRSPRATPPTPTAATSM